MLTILDRMIEIKMMQEQKLTKARRDMILTKSEQRQLKDQSNQETKT